MFVRRRMVLYSRLETIRKLALRGVKYDFDIGVRICTPLATETLSLRFIPYSILYATVNISIRYRYPATPPPSVALSLFIGPGISVDP
jgi:hypothetical protein